MSHFFHATDIVGYTYNAAIHCPDCAEMDGMDTEGARDSEGNEPGAIFAGHEFIGRATCDQCAAEIEAVNDICGGDFDESEDCPHCGDSDPDHDWSMCLINQELKEEAEAEAEAEKWHSELLAERAARIANIENQFAETIAFIDDPKSWKKTCRNCARAIRDTDELAEFFGVALTLLHNEDLGFWLRHRELNVFSAIMTAAGVIQEEEGANKHYEEWGEQLLDRCSC